MPVLEMDAISRERTLTRLANALWQVLSAHHDGMARDELFRIVIEAEHCYVEDLVLALSRLDVIESDHGNIQLAA